MVLVYTNSKERAMHLAVLLEGVVLSPSLKVMYYNYYELHDQLEALMDRDGYVSSSLRGEFYSFVYSEGSVSVPVKMVDYDPEYRDLRARPVPFFPSPFETQMVDRQIEKRYAVYQSLCEKADSFINAATDDPAGELAFMYFQKYMGITKPSFSVRPKSMTRASVIEAFNSRKDELNRQDLLVSAQFGERLEWLFLCNATNALSTHNYERKLMPVGLMESVLLVMIDRHSEPPRESFFNVELELAREDGSPLPLKERAPGIWSGLPQKEAEWFAEQVRKAGTATAVNPGCNTKEIYLELPSAFSIQAVAGEFFESMSSQRLSELLTELYEHGLITWPNQSHCLPWEMRTQLSLSVAAFNGRPAYAGNIQPQQMDVFQGWAQEVDDLNRCGILITEIDPEKVPISDEALGLYNVIFSELVKTILNREHRTQMMLDLQFPFDAGQTVRLFEVSSELLPMDAPSPDKPLFPSNGEKLKVISVKVVPQTPDEPETEWSILRTIDSLLKDAGNLPSSYVADAIENLISWGHVKRNEKHQLVLTKAGAQVCKYLRYTSLWDVGETLAWFKRLYWLAAGSSDPMQFKNGMKSYITDICAELIDAADEICDLGGRTWDDIHCPLCGDGITEDEETGDWICMNNPKCRFKVPGQLYGHTMSNLDIAALLTDGITERIHDFSSQKGSYSARLKMDKGRVFLAFDATSPCPYCGGALSEYNWGVKCKNKDCGFSLNNNICGHNLTEQEMTTLLSMDTTENLKLVNRSGKAFSAALRLGEDKTVKFEFPPKKGS